DNPLDALDDAVHAGLLEARDEPGIRDIAFPHPLVQAAVYEQLGPAHRARLHQHAAHLVTGDGARLRHRVAAAHPPDDPLATELSDFAERQARTGAWAGAATTLVEASHLATTPHDREQFLLRALDAMIGAGDLVQAEVFAVATTLVGTALVGTALDGTALDGTALDGVPLHDTPLRDAVRAHLATVRGHRQEAERLFERAWRRCDLSADRRTAAFVAERRITHSLGRLRPAAIVDWARRTIALTPAAAPACTPADAWLAAGLGWTGRTPDTAALDPTDGSPVPEVRIACAPLRIAADDVAVTRAGLAQLLHTEDRIGSLTDRVWSYVWLSRAEFLAGAWDEAAMAAARAVALLEETRHEWLRPAARWAAIAVPAARGDWQAAEDHAHHATAHTGDYELMIVASALAHAQLAAARADHDTVLRALEPLRHLQPRDGLDEPGFWPWHSLYADALVTAGRLDEADTFLTPHEQLATQRARRSTIAHLARARGRLEAAAGHPDTADTAFRHGLAQLTGLAQPFPQALLELAYGQTLRRHGQRRAAAEQLHNAHHRFTTLGARPYIERCERELSASGLTPAKRHDFDPSRLTAQELAVAQLVARGLSNRHVAAELFISIKTVQFHLTRIYSKLRISSRAELAARFRQADEEGDSRVDTPSPGPAASAQQE
ncbi:MAG: LuxR C-terminal-related transcriptional regulator, partial [Thermoleophilia bacterium]